MGGAMCGPVVSTRVVCEWRAAVYSAFVTRGTGGDIVVSGWVAGGTDVPVSVLPGAHSFAGGGTGRVLRSVALALAVPIAGTVPVPLAGSVVPTRSRFLVPVVLASAVALLVLVA